MTAFQILAISVLGYLALRDVWRWSQIASGRGVRALRIGVWVAAAVSIADPLLLQAVANLLGIGRAADVVLYLFVLTFLWVSFYFYSRCVRLEREITQLTRHLAIRDAARGPVAGADPDGTPAP